MVGREIADLEEDVLDSANGGFGLNLGRVGDDLVEGFGDGGARGDYVGAGARGIPVLFVLSITCG